jgi:NAD-dependent SIR2 family protein deacetylase
MPTPTHMSLVELQNQSNPSFIICSCFNHVLDQIQYIISQNVDGLHRRSGILPNKLSELHGNTNLETCSKCGKEYLRGESLKETTLTRVRL